MRAGIWAGVAIVCCALHGMAQEESNLLKPGEQAPPFSLPTLQGAREALRVWCGDSLLRPHVNQIGHTVILNFWATYCKPCQKEIPLLSTFMARHASDPIKLFCISIDKEGAGIVQPFIAEKGYDVSVLLDPYARTAQRYGVKSVPALFVIAPDGVIHYAASGFDENSDLLARLEGIYAGIKAGAPPGDAVAEVIGEQVALKGDASARAPLREVLPRERWKAVARIECGEKPAAVARDVGVSVEELKAWYDELKRTALDLWASERAR